MNDRQRLRALISRARRAQARTPKAVAADERELAKRLDRRAA